MNRFIALLCLSLICNSISFAQSFRVAFLSDAPLIVDAKDYYQGDTIRVIDQSIIHLKKDQTARLVNIFTGEQYYLLNEENKLISRDFLPFLQKHGMYVRGGDKKLVLLDTLLIKLVHPYSKVTLYYQATSGEIKQVELNVKPDDSIIVSRSDLPDVKIGKNEFTVKRKKRVILELPSVIVPSID